MSKVPGIGAVIRGAGVNIVLKADQRTGRTVSGRVQDVLTKGNHPRGIKVRLTDGRVGRVQTMIGPGQQQPPQEGQSGDTSLSENMAVPSGSGGGRGPARRHHPYQDVREEELPAQTIGLDAYIKTAKVKKRATKPQEQTGQEPTGRQESVELVKCPVCGDFEGDAAAVEHHVATHFD